MARVSAADTASLLKDMKKTAMRMRAIIVGMPPEDLLGYIYSQRLLLMMAQEDAPSAEKDNDSPKDEFSGIQFLLEYVHAVLASDVAPAEVVFDEAQCVDLFALSLDLQRQAMFYAIASTVDTKNEDFGPATADVEFQMKSTWVSIRGNRYQVLEGEFYRYVLAPHNDVLVEVYGVGAAEIATGFQDMADATRMGQANAIECLMLQIDDAQEFAKEQGKPLKAVFEAWGAANTDQVETAALAANDMFGGGIANVSRHTKLPQDLLADLAYQRGEETEFFADGEFTGTPFRTLPARKKPLIQIGADYYAVDPCFIRDAGYRALLYNLLQRKPKYKRAFEDHQKIMSEAAFPDILKKQLSNAKVYQEVYYKDSETGQWCENDTIITIDDVLYLVEAKSGAAATIASPSSDFNRHAQSVRDLVLKAYEQCERFFRYIDSDDEVPLYKLEDGKHVEIGLVRRADYRVMIPIGLTVESYSPFSTFCKELPQIVPLLGKHAFISMSIDDLFVLKRFLRTSGAFAHYMEVRQAAAGIRRAHLFDEFDHLGAYITKNRFDQDIVDQFADGKPDMVVWDGMSDVIDKAFESENWQSDPMPDQEFPEEVSKLLKALDNTQAPGWLAAESLIRNYGELAREELAKLLLDLVKTLKERPSRYFAYAGEDGSILFVWLQDASRCVQWEEVNDKASAVALYTRSSNVTGMLIEIDLDGSYVMAKRFEVSAPSERTDENARIFDDAMKMSKQSSKVSKFRKAEAPISERKKKIGRNETCPCGSGLKYKKCHGK